MMDGQRTEEETKSNKMESDDVKHLFDKLSDICKRLEEKGEKVFVFTTAGKNSVGEHVEKGFIPGTVDMLTKFQQFCEGEGSGFSFTGEKNESKEIDQTGDKASEIEIESEKHEEDTTIQEHIISNEGIANENGDNEMMVDVSTDERIHQNVGHKKVGVTGLTNLNRITGGTEDLPVYGKVKQSQRMCVDNSKNVETRSDLNSRAVSEPELCQRRSTRLEKKGIVKLNHRVLAVEKSHPSNNQIRKTSKKPQCCECKKQFSTGFMLREHIKKEHMNSRFEMNVKAVSADIHDSDGGNIESACDETEDPKQEGPCNNTVLNDKEPTASSVYHFKCEKCGLEFTHEQHLKTHQRKIPDCVSGLKEFECENDSNVEMLTIISKDTQGNQVKVPLKDLLSSQNKQPYQCPACSSSFNRKSNLKRHVIKHSDCKQITCYICGMKLKGRDNYSKHMKDHTERPFHCEKCDKKRFMSEAKLLDHMSICNKYTRDDLTCDRCGHVAKCRAALKIHLNAHLGIKPHACDHCGKRMSTMASLERHIMNMHQDDTPFECEICHKTFKVKDNYKKHQKHHQEPKYKCEVCGKTCIEYGNLKKHMLSHTKEKPFICEICGSSYSRNNLLENHRRIHTGEKPYKCTEKGCDKTFRSYANMKQHVRTHSADKPYVCDVCGKAFKQPGRMNHHRKSHLVKYRWPCAYCPEKFKTLFVYKGHLAKEHPDMKKDIESKTNIKLYQCHLCEKVYGDKEDLVRHIYIHKGLKPFQCEYCIKAFNDKSNLKQHTRIHLNDRKYACHFCSKSFVLRKVLRAHLSNSHGLRQPQNGSFQRKEVYKQKHVKPSVNKLPSSDLFLEEDPLSLTKETHVIFEKEVCISERTEPSHELEMDRPRPFLDKEFQLGTENENLEIVPNLQPTQHSRTPMVTVEYSGLVQPVIVFKNAYT